MFLYSLSHLSFTVTQEKIISISIYEKTGSGMFINWHKIPCLLCDTARSQSQAHLTLKFVLFLDHLAYLQLPTWIIMTTMSEKDTLPSPSVTKWERELPF